MSAPMGTGALRFMWRPAQTRSAGSVSKGLASVLLGAFLATGSAAEPTPAPSCRQLAEGLLENGITDQSKVQDLPDGCLFTHVRAQTGVRDIWTIDELRVTGLAPWDRDISPFPSHAKVEAKGIFLTPKIEDTHLRYQMALVQKPFDARFEFDIDFPDRRVRIRELALESPWLGHIALSVDGQFPADSEKSAFDLEGVRISQARFVLDNKAVLESMIMPAIIALVPDDKDPGIEFPRLQKESEQRLKKIPAANLDTGSRDALIRFMRDFPHPSGHFELELVLAKPLQLANILRRKEALVQEKWLNGGRIRARYEPIPAQSPP